MRSSYAPSTGQMLLARRLQDFVLWGLEALLCFILLDKREREAGLRAYASGSSRSKPAEPASAYLGHGCLGLFHAEASTSDPFLNRPALGPKAACEVLVLGQGALVDDLLDHIRAEGATAHAVAHDIDACLRLIQKGVTPHRLDDLSNQASRINLVISTSLTHFVDAGVLARLPEDAVILDLAALPGSVNYELAKKFDLKVIWAPPPVGIRLERVDPKIWREILAILTGKRDSALSFKPSGSLAPEQHSSRGDPRGASLGVHRNHDETAVGQSRLRHIACIASGLWRWPRSRGGLVHHPDRRHAPDVRKTQLSIPSLSADDAQPDDRREPQEPVSL